MRRLTYLGHHPLLRHYMRKREINRMTPQQVRKVLAPHVLLCGLEVDHIIPKSVGGWDHPRNYCLVPIHLNRAWANNWTSDKRAMLGPTITQSACGFARWATAQAERNLPL